MHRLVLKLHKEEVKEIQKLNKMKMTNKKMINNKATILNCYHKKMNLKHRHRQMKWRMMRVVQRRNHHKRMKIRKKRRKKLIKSYKIQQTLKQL